MVYKTTMFTKGNLRKNFLRVKQTADQKLGRVEKTEVLSDDLQSSEKRVEVVKQVSSNTVKKLAGSLLVTGSNPDGDKRLRKMPEAGLAHGMIESATVLGTDNIMGQMFQMCGDCQNTLAKNHLEYELEVEQKVLKPVEAIVENEIPQISKLKKALTKVTLDMDSAKSRWHNAVRQSQVPGINIAAASAKADTVKEEYEEAESRVDQARDAYTTGIFSFISRETDHSANLIHLLEAQAKFHKQALDIINEMLPKMQESLHCNPVKPVYGTSLEEHLRVTNRDIAQVLEACVCYLLDAGLEEEGLFRIAGMASKVKKLKASFDAGIDFEDSGELDPHTVAGALKQYLRELPEPLLTYDKFSDFMAAAQLPAEQRLQALWCTVDSLPKPNYDNFRYLIKFLAKLTERSEVNKMSPGNIAIVIGPNLIWSEGDNGPNMMNTGILSLITELIVQHADWFFPGDQDFHSTQRDCAPEHKRAHRPQYASRQAQGQTEVVNNPIAIATTSQQSMITPKRSKSTAGQACSAAFSAVMGPISGQQSSQDSVSSSSESTSLSDVTSQMREYEDADTLERRDSVDHYLTARGDLSEPLTFHTDSATNTKRTNPIITFNPNERHKFRKASTKKAPAPKPRSGSIPENLSEKVQVPASSGSSQNVHSDMYSTAFALQSLGDGGTWPSYLSRVRNIWDDKLQNAGTSDTDSPDNSFGKGQARSDQDIAMAPSNNQSNNSPATKKASVGSSEHPSLERSGSNQSGSSLGTPQSSPAANQEPVYPQTPPTSSRSPSVSPAASNTNLTGAPIVESEELHPVMRRQARKPAPPPPERPDRPYSVAVSASVKVSSSQYQTWPRQQATYSDEEGPSNVLPSDKVQTLPHPERHDRPNPPERVSSLPPGHHPHSDRPKVPPPVVPPTHKRSASTGAPVLIPGGQIQAMNSDSATGSSPYLQAGGSHEPVIHNHSSNQLTPSDKLTVTPTSSFTRQSVSRPPRPLPPPPPPPENSIVEQTHL